MHQKSNDLKECKVKRGELVLLVNETFSPWPPDYKNTREPDVILSKFDEFCAI